MKIKTVWDLRTDSFDQRVNDLLADGWQLTRREILKDSRALDDSAFYAELVLLDPAPGLPDPLEAVRAIREMCESTSLTDCMGGKCPLEEWRQQLASAGDPTDWVLPEEEVVP